VSKTYVLRPSFVVCELIAKLSKYYSDSEFVKDCLEATGKIKKSVYTIIIHQQNLGGKSIQFEHIIDIVRKTINSIKSRALRLHQFKELLQEQEDTDSTYYTAVRWLSRGKMLRKLYDSIKEIKTFFVTVSL
jgi:hypothetical protein